MTDHTQPPLRSHNRWTEETNRRPSRLTLVCIGLAAIALTATSSLAGPPGAEGDLYVATDFDGVLQYDGATGALVGPFGPAAGAYAGMTFGPNGNLFVSDWVANSVVEFDGTTGALVGTFASSGTLIDPRGLTFGPSGNLFVASSNSSTNAVIEFDGVTGALIGTFAIGGGGLDQPNGLVFGPNGNLLVSSFKTHEVVEYDGATGALIGVFAEGVDLYQPEDLVFGPNGNLFVCSSFGPGVLEYDGATGDLVGTFADEGLNRAMGVFFGPEGGLFVANNGDEASGAVNEYYSNSGGSVRSFADLRYPRHLAVKPFAGAAMPTPTLTAFAPAQATNCEPLVDALISGSGLEWGAQLRLTKVGEQDVLAVITDATPGTGFTVSFDVTSAAPGLWDLRLDYPDGQSDTLTSAVDLAACMPPVVTGFGPVSADNCGPLGGATITGSGFVSGATVVLSRPGQTDVVATNLTVESSTTISAGFDLDYTEPGLWDAVVVNPDAQSAALPDALNVTTCESRTVLFGDLVVLTDGAQWDVALDDLNGDGNLDMVAVSEYPVFGPLPNEAVIVVLMGRGDGLFEAPVPYPTGVTEPQSVTIGDLDGDGYPDVAASTNSSIDGDPGWVTVLLNNGDGTLASPVNYQFALGNGTDVEVGDLDGDGDLDLAVTLGWRIDTPYIAVLLNNGDGSFADPVLHAANCFPHDLALGDFDADGDVDVAVANRFGCQFGPEGISILLNNGDATFAAPVLYQNLLDEYPRDVSAGDLNGDGVLDLVVVRENFLNAQGNGDPGWVTVVLGNGDGTFTSVAEYGVQETPFRAALGDLDDDGDLDLIVANIFDSAPVGSGSISVLLNNGDATFPSQVLYDAHKPATVALGDVDNDGDLDIAATVSGHPVVVKLNRGNGTFQNSEDYDGGGSPTSALFAIGTGDLDGDGDVDLVTANYYDDIISVLMNDGSGVLSAPVSYIVGDLADPGTYWTSRSITTGDYDSDGDLDVVVANEDDQTISLLPNNGDGTLAAQVVYGVPSRPREVLSVDLNGDGHLDLAVAGGSLVPAELHAASVLLNNGDGTFADAVTYGDGLEPRSMAFGDVDGDGDEDLVVCGLADTGFVVQVFPGNGDGTFAAPVSYDSGNGPTQISIVDLDGDGHLDMVWRSSVKYEPCKFLYNGNCWVSEISIRFNLGDGTFGERTTYELGTLAGTAGLSGELAIGDLDGDGDLDLVANESNSNAHFVVVMLNRGDGTFASRQLYGSLLSWSLLPLTLADLDGDGELDIISTVRPGPVVTVLFNRHVELNGIPACGPADVTTQGAGSGDPLFGVPDGIVTGSDINYYVNLWVAQDLASDMTTQGAGVGDPGYGVPDGLVTGSDINYYVNLWVAGCP